MRRERGRGGVPPGLDLRDARTGALSLAVLEHLRVHEIVRETLARAAVVNSVNRILTIPVSGSEAVTFPLQSIISVPR
jgi:hypothetical protein